MQVLHFSLLTALIAGLNPSQQDFVIYRGRIYESGKLHQLFDNIFHDSPGPSLLVVESIGAAMVNHAPMLSRLLLRPCH